MIVGSDKLIEWIRTNETPYWRILNNEKGGVIIGSSLDDNLSVEDSITRLMQALEMLGAGTYFVDAWYTGLSQNSRFRSRFMKNSNNGQELHGIGNLSGAVPQIDIREEIRKGIDEYKREQELAALRAENQELKSQVDNFFYRILNRLEPIAGPAIQGIMKEILPSASPAIAGNQNEPQNETDMIDPKDQVRLENAFGSWGEMDPDCIALVEKIAELAKTDPATYNMAKGILMKK